MMALINVVHPLLPPAEASLQTEEAFKQVFKAKGWVQITDEETVTHNQAIADGADSPILAALKKKGGDK